MHAVAGRRDWLQILWWVFGLVEAAMPCNTLYYINKYRFLEASTGIEPVYTDLQSAASPLRQLAFRDVAST